jgi:hypothetical protein
LAGGQLIIETSAGKGTIIHASFPVDENIPHVERRARRRSTK